MPGCAVSQRVDVVAPPRGTRRASSCTASCGPLIAASAAFCVIDVMFDVDCPWMMLKTEVSSFGAIVQPQRQPVIA